MSTTIGPETSTQNYNKLRSTFVYGNLANLDTSTKSILAAAAFQRNVTIGGNLILGTETIDPSGNAIDSSSNIQFTLNKTLYNIPLKTLSYISNLSSDCQQQINNIVSNSGIISNVGYLTQTLPDITSTQFGTNAYNKSLLTTTSLYNTAFGGNTLYNNTTGNFNTTVGHSSGFANTTGSCNTGVGQQALSKNTTANYNTAVGFLSSANNTTGTANTSMGCYSLANNITGNYNTAIGFFSSTTSTTASSNSSIGYQTLYKNTTGNNNSAFGFCALQNNTTGYNNTSLGTSSGQSMITTTNSTCIGTNSDTSYSYSTALGCNSICTADHQIMLAGTANETVVAAGNLSVAGTINNISKTVLGYLSNVSSDIQAQLTTIANNKTFNSGLSASSITFSGSINSISAATFAYLANVTSDIQQQLNAISSNVNPVGSVIAFAGNASSLNGYLPCDGNQYLIPEYLALFRVIGYTYGGDEATGYFRVPNYKGIFLRGASSQTVSLNAIAGSGNAVAKTYTAPPLGTIFPDETQQITTSSYVNSINQQVKSFITSANAFGPPNYNFNYSNAVASLNYTSGSDILNNGHTETFPVHTSIQYFIKY